MQSSQMSRAPATRSAFGDHRYGAVFETNAFRTERGKALARWTVRAFLVVLLAVGPCLISANANDAKRENGELGSRLVLDWLREIEIAVRVHANPLERTIVCWLPFTDISIQAMSQVTGHTKHQITYGHL